MLHTLFKVFKHFAGFFEAALACLQEVLRPWARAFAHFIFAKAHAQQGVHECMANGLCGDALINHALQEREELVVDGWSFRIVVPRDEIVGFCCCHFFTSIDFILAHPGRGMPALFGREHLMEASFRRAANRRAHELSRLSDEQKEQLRARLAQVAARHTGLRRHEETRQRDDRSKNVEEQMYTVMVGTLQPQLNWRRFGRAVSSAREMRKEAERRVERSYRERLSELTRDAAQEHFLCMEAYLSAIPDFAAERASIESQRERWAQSRAATEVEFGTQGMIGSRRDTDGARER